MVVELPECILHYAIYCWLTWDVIGGDAWSVPRQNPPATWEDYARRLGVELQQKRLASGLSQEDLAHRAGVTRNYYQQLERGHLPNRNPTNPSLKVILRLARELGTELDELLPDASRIAWP
jgi:DNA-binding XRE family transcriptional regulator